MSTHIYLGPWINWADGTILGATITVSSRGGSLLTSFIATFVTIVGAQLWRILSYIFHQIRSSKDPQDGLHYQQQNILRNNSTPGGVAWSFFEQTWYWRGKASRVLLRTLPWTLFSIIYLALFGVLATFSSEVSKATGHTRLLKPGACGYWLTGKNTSSVSHCGLFRRLCSNNAPGRLHPSLQSENEQCKSCCFDLRESLLW